MKSLSSLLVDSTKFDNIQKLDYGTNNDIFIGNNLLQKKQNLIKYFKFDLNILTNQKLFFDEVEMSRKIESPFFAKMTGFSLSFFNPEDKQYYPAILYEKIPSFQFKDAFRNQQNSKTFTSTQKSIIAFKILVSLESIYNKEDINYCFRSDSIYLTSDRIPILFYEGTSTKYLDSDFYWIAPEFHLNTPIQETTNVYSFGMFLYELLGDDPSFFTQSKKDLQNFIKTKNYPSITTRSSISTIISLCLNHNQLERPKFSTILKMFIIERISFPGTDQEEFYKYKRDLYIKLDRQINLYFYSESNLRVKSLKGSPQKKYYLGKLLIQKIEKGSNLTKEEKSTIKDELASLILSLVQTKQKNASKLYFKYFLHHMSEIKEYPIKPYNLEENILNDPKARKLYIIYQLINGNITPSLCSICDYDPIIQIEYACLILKSENSSKEMIIFAFCLLSNALTNPKLDIDSKYWYFCKSKLIKALKIKDISDFVSQNMKNPIIIITLFICNGSYINEVEKLGKNGYHLANYFIARNLINQNKISEPITYLKMCTQQLPGIASYALGIVYLKSCNNLASFSMSACLSSSDPMSPLFQMAAETMAEMSYDNTKIALMYLNIAPKMTERKKFMLALITHKIYKMMARESNSSNNTDSNQINDFNSNLITEDKQSTTSDNTDNKNSDNESMQTKNNDENNDRKLISIYDNLPMPISEANSFLSKNLYPLTILFRFCGIYLQKRFPHGAHETEMSYKARMSSVQVPFILGCRYFIGYYIPRNYFLAEKYFLQNTQLHKNDVNQEITKEICDSCYNILKYEDFREKVPEIYIETLMNYIRKSRNNVNSNINDNVMTKEEMKSSMKNTNDNSQEIDGEQIKEALEMKEKIDKIFRANLDYLQLLSIANDASKHTNEKLPDINNHSLVSNSELNNDEFVLLQWYIRNWKEISLYLKQ